MGGGNGFSPDGMAAQLTLTPGSYGINMMLFQVSATDMFRIQESMVGLVATLDRLPIERDQIAGKLFTQPSIIY